MTVEQLEKHLKTLAKLEETVAPVISCYLTVSDAAAEHHFILEDRLCSLRSTFSGKQRQAFQQAAGKIREFMRAGVATQTHGVAVFSRGGDCPFFLPLQFQVPLPNTITADFTPKIYSLVELRDTYDRYVILLMKQGIGAIIMIDLGAPTEQIWTTRDEHRQQADGQLIRQLERLISHGKYDHLMLVGDLPTITNARAALPPHLASKVVDVIAACPTDPVPDVIHATLRPFLKHRDFDSEVVTRTLVNKIATQGSAVTGTCSSFRAVKGGRAELLVLLESYDPGLGWECRDCGRIETNVLCPEFCPKCRSTSLRLFETREELVRLATRIHCQVEVVKESEFLWALGGVGCMVRLLSPANSVSRAA